MRTERTYGGGFRGCVATIPEHLCPLDAITQDSLDFRVDPQQGKLVKRKGSLIVGDVLPTNVGLTESKFTSRCRQIIELYSDSLTATNHPTHAAIYTNESTEEGCLYLRDTNGSSVAKYTLGLEYADQQFENADVGLPLFQMIPLWCSNSTTRLTRCIDATQRKLTTPGTRKALQVGNWLYAPNAQGTPMMWNRRFNNTTGTEYNVIRPWGHIPPLYPPTITAGGTTADVSNWQQNDKFYVTVIFEFEDGSLGMPFLSRGPGTILASGLGLVNLTGGLGYWDYIDWTHIPIGPRGTRRRYLCRGLKINAAAGESASLFPLGIVAIIENNTDTSFRDTQGTDTSTFPTRDDAIIRTDHIWPKRARFAFGNDGRVVIGGKLRQNPAGIILAPSGVTTTRDLNINDDSTTGIGATYRFFVRTTATELVIKKYDLGGGPSIGTNTITYATDDTLQKVVDRINTTTVASNAGEWVAQLAPGADANAPSTSILPTSTEDTGDDDLISDAVDATTGNIQAFCPASPVVLYMTDAYLANEPLDEQSIYFTGAGPGHAFSAANNFYVKNRRQPPNRNVGRFVGGAPLLDKFVLCYERGIYVLRNVRGGGTGEDMDYRLVPLNERRGCIAWDSVVAGDGWVGYMTTDGYVITDGEIEVIISKDVWNPKEKSGFWNFEMDASTASTAADTDNSRFHAFVVDGVIRINYRRNNASTIEDRGIEYDYSSNFHASGIPEVLMPGSGQPFGWSAPFRQNFATMGAVSTPDGRRFYAAVEGNTGSTGDGRIDQFDTGSMDNSSIITPVAYLARDLCDTMKMKQAKKIWPFYADDGGGVTLTLYRGKNRNAAYSIALPSTAGTTFGDTPIEWPTPARTETRALEMKIEEDGSSVNTEVWLIRQEVEVSTGREV